MKKDCNYSLYHLGENLDFAIPLFNSQSLDLDFSVAGLLTEIFGMRTWVSAMEW